MGGPLVHPVMATIPVADFSGAQVTVAMALGLFPVLLVIARRSWWTRSFLVTVGAATVVLLVVGQRGWAGVGAIGVIAGSFAAVSVRLELIARWVGARRRDLEGMIDEARGIEPVARPPARKRRRRARGARRRRKG